MDVVKLYQRIEGGGSEDSYFREPTMMLEYRLCFRNLVPKLKKKLRFHLR